MHEDLATKLDPQSHSSIDRPKALEENASKYHGDQKADMLHAPAPPSELEVRKMFPTSADAPQHVVNVVYVLHCILLDGLLVNILLWRWRKQDPPECSDHMPCNEMLGYTWRSGRCRSVQQSSVPESPQSTPPLPREF